MTTSASSTTVVLSPQPTGQKTNPRLGSESAIVPPKVEEGKSRGGVRQGIHSGHTFGYTSPLARGTWSRPLGLSTPISLRDRPCEECSSVCSGRSTFSGLPPRHGAVVHPEEAPDIAACESQRLANSREPLPKWYTRLVGAVAEEGDDTREE